MNNLYQYITERLKLSNKNCKNYVDCTTFLELVDKYDFNILYHGNCKSPSDYIKLELQRKLCDNLLNVVFSESSKNTDKMFVQLSETEFYDEINNFYDTNLSTDNLQLDIYGSYEDGVFQIGIPDKTRQYMLCNIVFALKKNPNVSLFWKIKTKKSKKYEEIVVQIIDFIMTKYNK